MQLLLNEFTLAPDVPGGMPEYRRSLVISFFFKFYWSVKNFLPGIHVLIGRVNLRRSYRVATGMVSPTEVG